MADTPDLRAAAQWLEGVPADWTLDLGAGLGANGFVLAGRGHRLLVVDTSLDRLRLLRRRAGDLTPSRGGPPPAVVAAAEALPFADGSLRRLMTKSVLIHTDLPRAADEIARVLPPGGRAALIEPQPGNPFARLYRRFLAPSAWAAITRYFDRPIQSLFARRIGHVATDRAVRPFYLFSFLAFGFQFGWPNRILFRTALALLHPIDRLLFHLVPPLARLAWFGVILLQKPETPPSNPNTD
jgi:SAM-dependent methyltransferase